MLINILIALVEKLKCSEFFIKMLEYYYSINQGQDHGV